MRVADVFISCTRDDVDRVKPIAERLSSLGYSVSFERADTEQSIDAARAVIVTWTHEARSSAEICAEACRALDTGKLFQIRLDGTLPPPPFDQIKVADLSSERAEWGELEADLAKLVRDGDARRGRHPAVGLFASPSTAGAPKLITFALVTSLVAYAGALTAARNEVMSPDQLQLAMTGVIGVAGASVALCVHRLASIRRADR